MANRCGKVGVFLLLVLGTILWGCGDQSGAPSDTRATDASFQADMDKPLPPKERKRVLVLHSYHPEYIWVKNVNQGILKGLAEERYVDKKNITLEYFHMDTKRKTSEAWKQEIAQKAMDRIKAWKPHVVIATDDNAQKYVVAPMKNSGTNFVFLGVNADPTSYGFIDSIKNPGGNISGSIERARLEQTINLLRKLVPGVSKIAIVCDDSPTGMPVVQRVTQLAPQIGLEIVDSLQTGDFEAWKKFVTGVQTQADALLVVLYHTLKDKSGAPVHENAVLNWTIKNNKLPDMGFWSWAVDGGLLCSEAISDYQQGHYAATVASYVLMGQSPGDFPVDKPQRGEVCINAARAKMLNINVPEELLRLATVYNKIASDEIPEK
jgi:ABC-type uncharacterized transport system substrate-binding protein